MDDYVIVVNGKPEGPYSLKELHELNILPDTFIRKPGMDDYKEAHELPELREIFGFTKQIALPQYFASLDVRLLAVIIDYLIVFGVYCLLALLAVSFIDEQFLRVAVSLSGLILIPISKLILSSFMESSTRQATYGKSLLGLKVSDVQGLRISRGKAILRNLSKLICIGTLGIGYLIGFFGKKQQCLHDKIAGTLVIKDRLL
ncbi:MAG: hypothetical protein JWN56_191 [Sphingobacteriales bacterium]|nr:hypothetical protein [Sphingobacteriales bacterium]